MAIGDYNKGLANQRMHGLDIMQTDVRCFTADLGREQRLVALQHTLLSTQFTFTTT